MSKKISKRMKAEAIQLRSSNESDPTFDLGVFATLYYKLCDRWGDSTMEKFVRSLHDPNLIGFYDHHYDALVFHEIVF